VALSLLALPAGAETIAVRHPEGLVHGFLVLRSAAGDMLADGELLQDTRGDVVTSELVFHFKDGSLHDETAVFNQAGRFRLLRYRLRQKGASFPHPVDFSLDGKTGQSSVSSLDDDGHAKVDKDRLEKTPQDLANGMLPILLKNVEARGEFTLSMLAATPKPRMVTLHVESAPDDVLFAGEGAPRARHFVVKVELHGLTGLMAPLVGKQPPDTHFWILPGEFPAFLRAEGALYVGGPIWRIELASPHWARS
jgi:hypothetical protein